MIDGAFCAVGEILRETGIVLHLDANGLEDFSEMNLTSCIRFLLLGHLAVRAQSSTSLSDANIAYTRRLCEPHSHEVEIQ